MLLPFKTYNSITLIREERTEELQKFKDYTHGERFVVTEKIHGANFEVATDGTTVRYASRNQVLGEGGDFYGYQFVGKFLSSKILSMFKDMKEIIMEQHKAADYIEAQGHQAERPDIPRDFQEISIRGELAGGQYPAVDYVCKEGHGQVGKGHIWYTQQKSFFAFEICVDGVPQDFYTLGTFCGSYGIPIVPTLFFGTFEECLEYSREHLDDNTMVPLVTPLLDERGVPIMEAGDYLPLPVMDNNTREGHVIASVTPKHLPNGKRMTFKHKGKKFLENKAPKAPKKKVEVVFSPEAETIFQAVLPMLSVERMEAVMSKEGSWEPKDFTKMCGLVILDALEELGENMAHITTAERKQLTKQLTREAAERLRSAYFA